jgi:hypothetical protein
VTEREADHLPLGSVEITAVPLLCLVVSSGTTELIYYRILWQDKSDSVLQSLRTKHRLTLSIELTYSVREHSWQNY